MMHISLHDCEEILLRVTLVTSAGLLFVRVVIIGFRDIRAELRESAKNSKAKE